MAQPAEVTSTDTAAVQSGKANFFGRGWGEIVFPAEVETVLRTAGHESLRPGEGNHTVTAFISNMAKNKLPLIRQGAQTLILTRKSHFNLIL